MKWAAIPAVVVLISLAANGSSRRPRKRDRDSMTLPVGFEANRTPGDRGVKFSREEFQCFRNETVLLDGTCESLLEKGKCQEGKWLVLDLAYAPGVRPACKDRPCNSDQVYLDGRCIATVNQTLCRKEGTGLYSDPYGLGVCDCKRDKARGMHSNGLCYPLYSRGPCSLGSQFVLDEEGRPSCRRDPCARRNTGPEVTHLYWEPTKACYEIDSRGPCREGQFIAVDPWLKRPWCGDGLVPWYLVDIPKNCMTDHSGNCVEGTKLKPPGEDYLAALLAAGEKRVINRG